MPALGAGVLAFAGCDGDATGSGSPDISAVGASVSSFRHQAVTVQIGAAGAVGAVPLRLVVPPAHGALDVLPSSVSGTITVTYTPTGGFVGGDEFLYEVGGGSDASRARVRITIRNRAPEASDAAVSTIVATPVEIELVADDADGDAVTFEPFQLPVNGTLGPVVATGPNTARVTYTPSGSFLGSDMFTFRAVDGIDASEPAEVTVDVPAEIAAMPLSITTDEDRAVTFDLQVMNPGGVNVAFALVGQPTRGHLTGPALAVGEGAPGASPTRVTYVPDPEFSGPDSFTFQATTANGAPSTATVDVMVHPVNDLPSFVMGPDIVTRAGDGPQLHPGWGSGISAGPDEAFGADARFRVFTGDPSLFGEPVSVDLDGTLRFTPHWKNHGTTTITIQLDDGDGGVTQPTTFEIEVEPPPPPPPITATFHQERFESKTGTSPALPIGPNRVRYAFVMEGYQAETGDRGYSDFTIGGVSGTKLANEFAEFNPAEQLSMFEVWRWRPQEVKAFSDLDYELTGGGGESRPRLVVFVDVLSVDRDVYERTIVSAENALDLTVAANPGDLIIDAYGLRSNGSGDLSLTYESGQTERFVATDPIDAFDDATAVIVGLGEKLATGASEDLDASAVNLTTPHYRIVLVVAQDDGN